MTDSNSPVVRAKNPSFSNAPRKRAAFLDRDGVINFDRGYVYRPEDFEWVPGIFEAARRLTEAGFLIVVVTNQSGIGRGFYSERQFLELTDWMRSVFAHEGVPIADVLWCPHHPTQAKGIYRTTCNCRKPAPGMLLSAAQRLGIDLTKSVIFGDKPSDMAAGFAAGCAARVLLATDGGPSPKAVPEATGVFRSLLEAVNDSWFEEFSKYSGNGAER